MEISHTNVMGKKDLKELKKQIKNYDLDIKKGYKISKYKNKFFIVSSEYPMFFNINSIFYPTLKFLNENGKVGYKSIVLDEGARKQITRGADVMAGGIFINKNLCDEYFEGDVVVIMISGEFLAVGIALTGLEPITESTAGKVVDIFHYKGDELDNFTI